MGEPEYLIFVYAPERPILQAIGRLPGMNEPDRIDGGYQVTPRRRTQTAIVSGRIDPRYWKDESIAHIVKMMNSGFSDYPSSVVKLSDKAFAEAVVSALKEGRLPHFHGAYLRNADPAFQLDNICR
jgi:hypothetical protein